MTAPKLSIPAVECYEWPFALRLPFRFGAVTHTHGRQVLVRARVRTADGREGWGYAAEALAAKWFEKDPALTDEQNYDQLRASLEIAIDAYTKAGADTAFGHFISQYPRQQAAGAKRGLSPLVASYGPALLDRAVLDALCRVHGVSFYAAMRANLPGMRPDAAFADLGGYDFGAFLGALRPAASIHVRHTVGLVDPIVAADQAGQARVNDGLPETLEEVVERSGCRYFKLKVGGDVKADLARLTAIAQVLDRRAGDYHVTLDGNEQYAAVEGVLELWNAIERTPVLTRLVAAVLFIEQPIKRAAAMSESVAELARKRSVIIDESDGELDSFPRARALGYRGVSSKSCKGFYKSIINAARVQEWNRAGNQAASQKERGAPFILSGEDLTTLAGLCVQQDLALVNLLGVTHVERNGHHFVDGMRGRPPAEQAAYLAAHPDLYERARDTVRLRLRDGQLAIGSLDCPGFGTSVTPDVSVLEPMPVSAWRR